MIVTASSWSLAESAGYHREAARPRHLRPADFAALFDAQTVFYDCVRLSPSQVMLIGPPLVRFAGILDSLTINAVPGGEACRYRVEHKATTAFGNRKTHNLCRVVVDVPATAAALHVRCKAGDVQMAIEPNAGEHFRGHRVLLTLSRNNDPAWICDWMRFHRDLQGADAVLLYDNGSTAYRLPALLEAMSKVAGFARITVVAWPYKYGPQGLGRGTWDSAFCQNGALEDARWRFLGEASAVLSCDIDELVLSPRGSVFAAATASAAGYVRFAGRWVNPRPQAGNAQNAVSLPRHVDSTQQVMPRLTWRRLVPKDINLSPPKWAVVPGRCPPEAHWSVHEIVGMRTQTMKLTTACYRHFQNISTHWKKTRARFEPSTGVRLKDDTELQQAFAKVRWLE
jgi:hypothetical protein